MKFIAYFLPQFYTTPENDKYWGKGFTDWVNVKKAQPLFKGHRQPIKPVENNYYDLSDPNTLKKLCQQAIINGIDGFGYWHYWFGNGFKTLEKVQELHLSDQTIKQNYFFAWANQDWTKSWIGEDSITIFKQIYTEQSAIEHFDYLVPFFEDSRYIRYKSLPVLQVINPDNKGVKEHIFILEKLAVQRFGKGIHWLFPINKDIEGLRKLNYSLIGYSPGDITSHIFSFKVKRKLQKYNMIKKPIIISEDEYIKAFTKELSKRKECQNYFPTILSGWDNTPRYVNKGFIIDSKISNLIKRQLEIIFDPQNDYNNLDFVFFKAWNEWAEGNIMEDYFYNGELESPANIVLKFRNFKPYMTDK